jgi:translation initiation factor 1
MKDKDKDWKKRLNVVYSTNPDFGYETEPQEADSIKLPPEKQQLRITLDKRHRHGKSVTLITGFAGTSDELEALEKLLKYKCGIGGTSKDGEILLQGDFRQKACDILQQEGYAKTKIIS